MVNTLKWTDNIEKRFHRKLESNQNAISYQNENVIKLQNSEQLLDHNEQIDAILISLKPSLCHMFFKKYEKDELKEYFQKLRTEDEAHHTPKPDLSAVKTTDMENLPTDLSHQPLFVNTRSQGLRI